jgi:hypothetical protein
MNKNKNHTIQHDMHDATPEEATKDFIARTKELLAQLEDGRHVLHHAILSAMVIALPEEIDAVADEKLKTELLANPGTSGIETTIGAGDPNRLMDSISRLPELFAQGLIEEHHKECDEGDQCALNDPDIAPYVGTLKAMAMVYARASHNIDAVQLLHKSLKDMGRKALRVAEMHKAMAGIDELGENPQAIALGGDKAMAFMKLLADSGLLPPEAAEKIKADMAQAEANNAETGLSVQEHTDGRNVTVIKNGPSTKQ